ASTFPEQVIDVCDLRLVAQKLAVMAAASDRYDEWACLKRLRGQLETGNLHDLIPLMELGKLDKDEAVAEFLFARAEAIWKLALGASPSLSALRNVDRHELVKNFSQLEKERRSDCVKFIRASHLGQVPQGAHGAMAVIRGEIVKKRAHIPLRKLFSNAAEAIQRIKPVLMMSPISVAQFLPPGSISFDLLIIDEASQVRPEDALGAIARAKQIVVVGDQKQLPPSSFFDRLASNGGAESDDEKDDSLLEGAARVGELESILTLCEARGLNSRMLEWHYRSRDPSLIRVSNHEFYRDGLILPPSPLQNDRSYGLIFSRIAGIYDRGGKRDNRLEGEAIVKRVVEHAEAMPTLSLGIVTFSSAQRNLITELLEYHRRQNPVLDIFLREGCNEDVFVKNIENVQGDERDVILVSVGYGPTEVGGRPKMHFGPVNREGGERRLNVMFTRARVRCEVFCSFDPGDMDLTKTSMEGPKILKRFLEFAKTGMINDKAPTGEGPDTPFEEDVAAAIARMGYSVDHQVGSAGFLIDLGIRHPDRPGTYILAVECDGATYHSALWARERDRLRQDVLENLGWRFHRIWSTDWFYRRAQELDLLRNALTDAKVASEKGIVIKGANENASAAVVAPLIEQRIEANEAPQRTMPLYSKSAISIQTKQEPHEVDLGSLARL
ncbi:MAG: AAA domain-containing protein, partial [Methylobacter sp.]|nr:AAA domain-containing protein [Methylobacter sp.]